MSNISLDDTQATDLAETNIKTKKVVKIPSYTVEEKRKYNANAYKSWIDQDDKKLVELHTGGMSIKDLSQYFKRNKGSILSRLKKLVQ